MTNLISLPNYCNTHSQAVYLLHFSEPYKHARHYLGWSPDLAVRLARHEAGTGARLTQVVREAGITWVVARTWKDGTRALERRLKGYHSGVKLCPICQGKVSLDEMVPSPRKLASTPGRRRPIGALTLYFP